MAAIITDKIKFQMLKDLLQDRDSTGTNYYIGIGRSQQWNSTDTPPSPANTDRDERDFRSNLQSVIAVDDVSFVVPRNEWASGNVYSAYSDNVSGYPTNPYYVVTDEEAVYICIKQGKNSDGTSKASEVQPTGQNTFNTGELADGYIWKFLYTIGAAQDNSFVTAAFIPVTLVDSALNLAGLGRDVEQYGIQNAALPGQILGFRITNAGSGISTDPTAVYVDGDNDPTYPAKVLPVRDPLTQTIVDITFEESGGSLALGRGYTRASVVLPGGAKAQPIIGPVGGLGADPRLDLKSTALMYNARPVGREGGDFVVENDYRQFGLLRNITLAESDGGAPDVLFSATTGRAMRRMVVSGVAVGKDFGLDDSINDGTATAIIDSNYEDTVLYYHQSEYTGFKSFTVGNTVTGQPSTQSGTIVSDSAGDINPYSGEVLFISNRTGKARGADQTEDLKIIVQL